MKKEQRDFLIRLISIIAVLISIVLISVSIVQRRILDDFVKTAEDNLQNSTKNSLRELNYYTGSTEMLIKSVVMEIEALPYLSSEEKKEKLSLVNDYLQNVNIIQIDKHGYGVDSNGRCYDFGDKKFYKDVLLNKTVIFDERIDKYFSVEAISVCVPFFKDSDHIGAMLGSIEKTSVVKALQKTNMENAKLFLVKDSGDIIIGINNDENINNITEFSNEVTFEDGSKNSLIEIISNRENKLCTFNMEGNIYNCNVIPVENTTWSFVNIIDNQSIMKSIEPITSKQNILIVIICLSLGIGAVLFVLNAKSVYKVHEEEIKNDRDLLRQNDEAFRLAMKQSNSLVQRYDICKDLLISEFDSLKVFGIPKKLENAQEDLTEKGIYDYATHSMYNEIFTNIENNITDSEMLFSFKKQKIEEVWYKCFCTLIKDDKGNATQAVISFVDYTQQYNTEKIFNRWKETYAKLPKKFMSYIDYNITNDTFGVQEGELIEEVPDVALKNMSSYIEYMSKKYVARIDRHKFNDMLMRKNLLNYFTKSGEMSNELIHWKDENNEEKFVNVSIQIKENPYNRELNAFIMIRHDGAYENEIRIINEKVSYDHLTGALSRSEAVNRINDKLLKNDRYVLIVLDLNSFKKVNDTYGHQRGDDVLQEFALRMREALREEDIFGRYGGDEFILFMSCGKDETIFNNRINELLKKTRIKVSTDVYVTASAGASTFPYMAKDFHSLFKYADRAMYFAKKNKIEKMIYYNEEVAEWIDKNEMY